MVGLSRLVGGFDRLGNHQGCVGRWGGWATYTSCAATVTARTSSVDVSEIGGVVIVVVDRVLRVQASWKSAKDFLVHV